ncbi:MAG: hypothetical protein RID91_12475 [Azospirillaceae bacterium]
MNGFRAYDAAALPMLAAAHVFLYAGLEGAAMATALLGAAVFFTGMAVDAALDRRHGLVQAVRSLFP